MNAVRRFSSAGSVLAAATASKTAAAATAPTLKPFDPAAPLALRSSLNANVTGEVMRALSSSNVSEWNVVLYQYQTCPYCNKVRAFLDLYQIPYRVVEVNPLSKPELKSWSKDYSNVPVITVAPPNNQPIRIVDSTEIISALYQALSEQKSEKAGKSAAAPAAVPVTPDAAKWRVWADESLIRLFPSNIYSSLSESFASFDYMAEASSMSKMQQLSSKVVGGLVMFGIGRRNVKKYGIKSPRGDLFAAANKWATEGLNGAKFHGGDSADLADVTVFGAVRSLAGFRVGQELFAASNDAVGAAFRDWYQRMCRQAPTSYRNNPLPKLTKYCESTPAAAAATSA